MSLKLKDLLKNAKNKGYISNDHLVKTEITKPWQNGNVIEPQKEYKPDTKGTQKEHNSDTKQTQKEHISTKIEPQKEYKPDTKGTQKKHNADTKQTQKEHISTKIEPQKGMFLKLVGLQKNIVVWIFFNIKHTKNKETERLTFKKIADEVDINVNSIKTTIQRLLIKKILLKVDEKRGRNGWITFSLNEIVFKEIEVVQKETQLLKDKKNTSHIYNSNSITITNINKYKNTSDVPQPNDTDKDKIIADLQKQLELQNQRLNHQSHSTTSQSEKDRLTDHINKKLNNIDTQINTENPADTQDDSEAWANIDFSALADYGFKRSHIKQIINANTSLTPQEVQDSIEHYAWALENRREEMKGYAPVSNPLRGLMGVLKKGNAWVEGSYKSPEELALELQIKNKRLQLERQQAKKDELFNIEFEIWYTKLTPEDIAKIEATNGFKSLPIATFNKKMSSEVYRGMMRRHYQENILNR